VSGTFRQWKYECFKKPPVCNTSGSFALLLSLDVKSINTFYKKKTSNILTHPKIYRYLSNRSTIDHRPGIISEIKSISLKQPDSTFTVYHLGCRMISCFFDIIAYLTENTVSLLSTNQGERLGRHVGPHTNCYFCAILITIEKCR